MLADVVVGEVGLVGEVESEEAGVGEVLLVGAEGDALGVEQVDDGRHVLWKRKEVVVVNAEVVATDDGGVVGLGGVGHGVVVGQGDGLLGELLQAWVVGGEGIVLVMLVGCYQTRRRATNSVLEPDLHDTVESLTLHVRGEDNGRCGRGESRDSSSLWLNGGLSRATGRRCSQSHIGAGEDEGSREEHDQWK